MKLQKTIFRTAVFVLGLLLFGALFPEGEAYACNGESSCAAHSGPCYADMFSADERVTIPDDDAWLDNYEVKYVKSKLGNCIILRFYPVEKFTYDGYNLLDRVWDREQVIELARQDGFSLVSTSDGQIGWVKSNLIVSVYR